MERLSRHKFQSTPPVWGATAYRNLYIWVQLYFNPRPPCGGRRGPGLVRASPCYFNPRPPCGGRQRAKNHLAILTQFQSTPPVWGATGGPISLSATIWNFNPRPPCGGRQFDVDEESFQAIFQSTPPVWGATRQQPLRRPGVGVISIHAPRVGGDTIRWRRSEKILISIHAPRVGGDEYAGALNLVKLLFQSTPPVWGATTASRASLRGLWISIHAPRVGGDCTLIC